MFANTLSLSSLRVLYRSSPNPPDADDNSIVCITGALMGRRTFELTKGRGPVLNHCERT